MCESTFDDKYCYCFDQVPIFLFYRFYWKCGSPFDGVKAHIYVVWLRRWEVRTHFRKLIPQRYKGLTATSSWCARFLRFFGELSLVVSWVVHIWDYFCLLHAWLKWQGDGHLTFRHSKIVLNKTKQTLFEEERFDFIFGIKLGFRYIPNIIITRVLAYNSVVPGSLLISSSS